MFESCPAHQTFCNMIGDKSMKQVLFYDRVNDVKHGGILMDNGDIICGCCGGLIPADEIGGEDDDHVILKEYDSWANLDEAICE